MIKNLIFDLDDTLVNDRENHKEAFKYILKFLKIDYTEELFQQWLDFDTFYWKDYFKTITVPAEYSKTGSDSAEYLRGLRFQLFFKTELDPFEMQKHFKEGLKIGIVPLDGAVEALKTLSKDYNIYISTNGDSFVAKEKINRIGLSNYINGIFSADLTNPPKSKSDLDYYQQLLTFIGNTKKEEYLMTGNSYHDDVIMPNKAGIKTCWLHDKKEDNVICDYQISNLMELINILKELNKKTIS